MRKLVLSLATACSLGALIMMFVSAAGIPSLEEGIKLWALYFVTLALVATISGAVTHLQWKRHYESERKLDEEHRERMRRIRER